MTVKHLQTVQQQQLTIAMATDPTVVQKFKSGFNECATEVSRYIGRMDGVEPCVKQRLVSHLASCVSGLKKMPTFDVPTSSSSQGNVFDCFNGAALQHGGTAPSEDVNNNRASARLQMMTGLQLIPSRLPTGELALLLPSSQQIPGSVISFFPPSQETNLVTTTSDQRINTALTGKSADRHHFSAFTAVNRDRHCPRSPLHSPSSSAPSTYCDDSIDRPYPSPSGMHEVTSTSEHDRFKHSDSSTTTSPVQTKPADNPLRISAQRRQNDSSRGSFSAFPSHPVQTNFHTPLTVITSDNVIKTSDKFPDVRFHHPANINKSPLDFSVRKDCVPSLSAGVKRRYPDEQPVNLLMKSDHPLKVRHCSLDDDRNLDLRNDKQSKSGECSSRPSTSSTDSTRDMWRPW